MSTPFAPYEPGSSARGKGPRTRRPSRFQRVPLRMILPNLVTLLALCSGLTAIRMALETRWDLAIGAIVLAAVLDGIDGRIARLLRSTSRFGAELDSLADFVNFGVAPAIILYTWILSEVRSLGWLAVLLFAICAALRLARFNVALDDPHKPAWQGNYFVGVPAPAGALSVLLPVYLDLMGLLERWSEIAPPVLIYTLAIGFLMVSRLPTFSGKKVTTRVRRDLVLPVFVAVVLLFGLGLSYPFEVLTAMTLGYLISIPFALRQWRRNMRAQVRSEESEEDDSTEGVFDPFGGEHPDVEDDASEDEDGEGAHGGTVPKP